MADKERRLFRVFSDRTPSASRILNVFTALLKPIGLFAGGLYLFGFGLFGVNRFGLVDALIPYERIGCLILGLAFLAWFAASLARLWKMLPYY